MFNRLGCFVGALLAAVLAEPTAANDYSADRTLLEVFDLLHRIDKEKSAIQAKEEVRDTLLGFVIDPSPLESLRGYTAFLTARILTKTGLEPHQCLSARAVRIERYWEWKRVNPTLVMQAIGSYKHLCSQDKSAGQLHGIPSILPE